MKENPISHVEAPAIAPLERRSGTVHRILVVDDDCDIRNLNAGVLVHSGYQVDVAEDGEAAWKALNADTYDLMITDNSMPRLSGVELLKKLHASRMTLPVIMATGTLPQNEFDRSPWLQPSAMLLKPYSVEQLLGTVTKVLNEANSTTIGTLPKPMHPAHRILVVDEDSDLRTLYAEALTVPGYHVDVAEDGAAGWEALQAKHYNLLITEHDLPKLNGIELVRKLRAAHMDIPVVMAAARMPIFELARTPSLNIASTLMKPFAMYALFDTVKNAFHATSNGLEPGANPPDIRRESATVGVQL